MNLKDILPAHLRSKVYFWVGLFGLVIGSGIVGVAALTAGGLAVPVAVTVGLSALNAVYVYIAGAFGFIAQANTPNAIQDPEDIDEATDDSGPVG